MLRRLPLHKGRVRLLVVLAALALTSLACGIGGLFAPDPTPEPTVEPTVEPTPEPTQEPTQAAPAPSGSDAAASLEVINNSSYSVCYLYVSPTEDTEWGDDQLGSDIVATGSTFTLRNIPPGIYDLRADDCEGNTLREEYGITLRSGTYPWTFSDSGVTSSGGSATASLEIINNSSSNVCYLYVSPSEDTEWGDDQLGSDIVASGATFTLRNIPPGIYDLRADDCEGNTLSQEFGIILESGTYPWTFSDSGVTFTIVNDSSIDLCWIYLSPSTDSEWGPDQLGSEILHAGESWVITGLEAGLYDLRVEACGEGELEEYGLDVSGHFEYTVLD